MQALTIGRLAKQVLVGVASLRRAGVEKLRRFQERERSELDVAARFIDGKSFADARMVLALGVTA